MKVRHRAPRRSIGRLFYRLSTSSCGAYSGRWDGAIVQSSSFSTTRPQRGPGEPSTPKTQNSLARDKLAAREFFLSVLSSTATKREAKSYLTRFKPSKPSEPAVTPNVQTAVSEVARQNNYDHWRLHRTGVNLGGLYAPARAIEESPVFAQQPLPERFVPEDVDPLHVAVVKIRGPQLLDDETLSGVALTLTQLAQLGLHSAVVVDCDDEETAERPDKLTPSWRAFVIEQALRVVSAIKLHIGGDARLVDQALTLSATQQEIPSTVHVRGGVEVGFRKLLLSPLKEGIIPVIPPIAYSQDTLRASRVQPDDAMLALTREFAGLTSQTANNKEPGKVIESLSQSAESLQEQTSLDRVIVLDPLGGIPAPERSDKAHVFINLEQEYRDIRHELSQSVEDTTDSTRPPHAGAKRKFSLLGASNPFSKFVEEEVAPISNPAADILPTPESSTSPATARHIKNLDLIQRALALLPPSSSALLTTPEEAASSAQSHAPEASAAGVRTRRQKNPLIHNLLTDKPMISSSLPTARLTSKLGVDSAPLNPATFVKRGMPLTIIPDPRHHPWLPPGPEGTSLSLDDPRIDFPRLLHLIEDSFNRPLDAAHYLSRVRNRLAGIIIAGEYEGGAILTWEAPPHDPNRPPVPYLDKFAVLKRSQGAGGVADVVFKAMVRSCFPGGVVWRSRQNNPVNKWYFERAVGTWKLPGTQWTMFWTGEGVEMQEGGERWQDCVEVCRGIEASWADQKALD